MALGRDYELIVKAIYETLLNQRALESVELTHNKRLQGRTGRHQIDVYWKFRLAGEEFQTIIEVRKTKARVKKKDLLAFDGVLKDTPGQPKGIFVALSGYQKGAFQFAQAAGITLIQLVPISRDKTRVTMTAASIARITLMPDKLAFRWAVKTATFEDTLVTFDEVWARENREAILKSAEFSMIPAERIHFCDTDGNIRISLRELIQERLSEAKGGERRPLSLEFKEPTFLTGSQTGTESDVALNCIKILKFTTTLVVTEEVFIHPIFREQYTTYLMSNLFEENGRFVLFTDAGIEPKALVSGIIGRFAKTVQPRP